MDYKNITIEQLLKILDGNYAMSVYKKFFTYGVEGSIDVFFNADEIQVYFEEKKDEGYVLEICFNNADNSVILKIEDRLFFKASLYENKVAEIWLDEFTRINVYEE